VACTLDQTVSARARSFVQEIAMSDTEAPQPNPEPAPTPGSPGDDPVGATPEASGRPAPAAAESHSTNGDDRPATPADPKGERFAGVKRFVQGRNGVWAAVAALCVAAGTVASVLGATSVAHDDHTKARQDFRQSVSATGIAPSVKLAIQHEEDLVVGASTFFSANPKATPTEFSAWAKWSHALRRYPELQRLALVAFVRPEPATSVSPSTARGVKATTALSAAREGKGLRITPASEPPTCAMVAQLVRRSAGGSVASTGDCVLTPGLLSIRDSGLSRYASVASGRTKALGILTPVYGGGVVPSTVAGRRAAFVGWLREVLQPRVVLAQALRGHANSAVRLRYRAGSSNLVFASGNPQPDAQSRATNLRNGWSLRSFGPPVGAGVLADANARVLLIAGTVLSVLLGLLVFLLGSGRARAPAPAPAGPPTREVPHEDLYDPLTGLPNRALMMDRAQRMLARAGRESGLLIGAVFVDIDWFKDVSEKIGKAAGDQLLTIVCRRLEGVVRAQDSVGRLEGDEFVILVESAARGARLESLARRVIEALREPVELDDFGPSFVATASLGVAFGRYATADDLLRDARLAMYAAKSAGKDRYTVFNANMRSVTENRATLEIELNAALQQSQFFLLYEPIVDLATRKLAGLEAQIRWGHPTQGIREPEDFIHSAEETGMIVPIGRWMLEEACSRAAAWNVAGHRVGISIKVSDQQLNREGFATDVRRALQQSGLQPSLLTLEVGETSVMRDVAAAAVRLEEIRRLGVSLAIDDFGSGSAYHSDLRQLPLDFLKVDRSTLAASDDEDYRSWLLEAIIVVGRDLSLPVIAKGVDSVEQMTALQAMGCAMAQGPFMGRPTPVEAVEALFHTDFPTQSASSPTELSAEGASSTTTPALDASPASPGMPVDG
jgi:diguanylate cyclase (GGDEF)-like protein